MHPEQRCAGLSELRGADDSHLAVFREDVDVDDGAQFRVDLSDPMGEVRRTLGVKLVVRRVDPLRRVGRDDKVEAQLVRLGTVQPDEVVDGQGDAVVVLEESKDRRVRMIDDVDDSFKVLRGKGGTCGRSTCILFKRGGGSRGGTAPLTVDVEVGLAGATVGDDLKEVAVVAADLPKFRESDLPGRVAPEATTAGVWILELEKTLVRRGRGGSRRLHTVL
jgi:hypothetical protein